MKKEINLPDSGLYIRPIAHIRTDFAEKFGIPRQSGVIPELKAVVEFEPAFRNPDIVRGLEEFSHIWLIWIFSANLQHEWSATVRPPRLGGNERKGVFATRSPFRPNPLGLSSVKLDSIVIDEKRGPLLHVSGADLMDQTPIVDIKPYIPGGDCHVDAAQGFTRHNSNHLLQIQFPEELLMVVPEDKRTALFGVLKQDPRPAYQDDPDREYGVAFAGLNVRFKVLEQVLVVTSVTPS